MTKNHEKFTRGQQVNDLVKTSRSAGVALPIAIVAKCEEIINLAQKIVIWRQLLAKKITSEIFCLASERHLASSRFMLIVN